MVNNNKHLLLFTIGPVQSFIAQARKTQDLYAGSKLLSSLIKTAMGELETRYCNVEFIFPKPQEDKDISYPNRFIASIPEANEDNLKSLGNDLKEKVISTFKNKFYIDAAKEARITLGQKDDYCRQIDGFLDINWVILPYEEKDYKAKYKKIERTLGAVKNVRDFNQLEEQGKKCSLCGERNVLFFLPTKDDKGEYRRDYQKKAHIQSDAINISHLNKKTIEHQFSTGEGLCAVCFTKRFYRHPEQSEGSKDSSDKSFPSTAGIALMDTIEKVKKSNDELIKVYQNHYFEHQSEQKFEYQLFYKENLSEAYLKKFGYVLKKDKSLNDVLKHQAKIENAAKSLGLKLNKYYAIIALDGDKMGEWLSGKHINNPDKELYNFHKSLSNKLGAYAESTDNIIKKEDGKGKLVYAGGDDVLAFVNLNHLTAVLKDLRIKFEEEVNSKLENKQKDKNLTVSCGVAIAHYKTPVNEVLKRARAAAKLAKSRFEDSGKDAMAITFMTKSGNEKTTVFKNEDFSTFEKVIFALTDPEKVKGNSENKFLPLKLSPKFIQTFAMEFAGLETELNYDEFLTYGAMTETELKRLIKRAIEAENDKNKETRDKLLSLLTDFLAKQRDSHTYSIDVNNFVSFLKIAESLTQEGSFYDNYVNKD